MTGKTCLAGEVATLLLGVLLAGGPVLAADHREATILTEDPAADITDVYAFVSPRPGDAAHVVVVLGLGNAVQRTFLNYNFDLLGGALDITPPITGRRDSASGPWPATQSNRTTWSRWTPSARSRQCTRGSPRWGSPRQPAS